MQAATSTPTAPPSSSSSLFNTSVASVNRSVMKGTFHMLIYLLIINYYVKREEIQV